VPSVAPLGTRNAKGAQNDKNMSILLFGLEGESQVFSMEMRKTDVAKALRPSDTEWISLK